MRYGSSWSCRPATSAACRRPRAAAMPASPRRATRRRPSPSGRSTPATPPRAWTTRCPATAREARPGTTATPSRTSSRPAIGWCRRSARQHPRPRPDAPAALGRPLARLLAPERHEHGHGRRQRRRRARPRCERARPHPGRARLTPNTVKALLEFTSFDVTGADALTQGAGALNAAGAIALGRRIDPAPRRARSGSRARPTRARRSAPTGCRGRSASSGAIARLRRHRLHQPSGVVAGHRLGRCAGVGRRPRLGRCPRLGRRAGLGRHPRLVRFPCVGRFDVRRPIASWANLAQSRHAPPPVHRPAAADAAGPLRSISLYLPGR